MRRLAAVPILLALAAALHAGDPVPVTPAPKVPLRFDRFYDCSGIAAALAELSAAWPGWLEVRTIGRSVEGRDIPLAVLRDPEGPPEAARPAMYIDGNIHGNEIQGAEVCLYTLWYLLEEKDRLPEVRELLRRAVFYVLPCVNPDGREYWFKSAGTAEFPRSGLAPLDEDRDGLLDEDGPNDLDDDGSITLMRKRVASGGNFRTSPRDPRRMEPAEPGQPAEWLLLGWEGIDDDGDGEINEDGPGGYDMNRNFPGDWRPEAWQGGAGEYPLRWPETRTVADFLLAHRNVAAVQSYHTSGGMIVRGPGNPEAEPYPDSDVRVFDELGRQGERILPFYRYIVLARDLYTAYGSQISWAYENLGVIGFTNELWAEEQYRGRRDDDPDARHRFDEDVELGAQFVPWRPFAHPTYGETEIGGFRKTEGRVPPPFMLPELCHRNMAFTLAHARELPELALGAPEVTPLPGGLFRIRAEVENRRLIPTRSAMARRHGLGRPDLFTVEVTGGRVVAGGILEGPPLLPRAVPQEREPWRLRVDGGVPSRGRVRAEWIVAPDVGAPPRFDVTYEAEKGGAVRATGNTGENK